MVSPPFKQIYKTLDGGDAAKTEVWLDPELDVDPELIQVTPRVEFVAIDPRHGGQRIGQKLLKAAEQYCAIAHCMADVPSQRPWSDDYLGRIADEGFDPEDLIVCLDTIWPSHTVSCFSSSPRYCGADGQPYYEKQGYTAFHRYQNQVYRVKKTGEWERSDMLVNDFFKRITVQDARATAGLRVTPGERS